MHVPHVTLAVGKNLDRPERPRLPDGTALYNLDWFPFPFVSLSLSSPPPPSSPPNRFARWTSRCRPFGRADGRAEDGHLTSDTKNGGGGQIELKRKPRKKEEEKGEERVSVVRLKEAASGFIRASSLHCLPPVLLQKQSRCRKNKFLSDDFQPSHDSRFPFSLRLGFLMAKEV